MIEIKYPHIKEKIDLEQGRLFTLVIEHPKILYEFGINLIKTLNKEDSKLYFVKKGEEIRNFNKIMYINNLFEIDINNKKFLTLLNKLIIQQLQTNMHEINSVYQQFYSIISNAIEKFDSPITINEEVDYTCLIKLFNPIINNNDEDLFEKIINFINVAIEFAELKLLIFFNIEEFLSEEELLELIKICNYKEVTLLFIQGRHIYKLPNEKCLIIDKDLCEIIDS
jgi:CRISPR type II-A-associated protein Csn2